MVWTVAAQWSYLYDCSDGDHASDLEGFLQVYTSQVKQEKSLD